MDCKCALMEFKCSCCGKYTPHWVTPICYSLCYCTLEDMTKCQFKQICPDCFKQNKTKKCKYYNDK